MAPQIRRKTESFQSMSSPVDRILFLQRTIGNQAVGRLIKSGTLQAKLRIGQPGDIYEQEADRVAERVMRMPDVSEAKDTRIQRKCPKCLNGLRGLLGKDKKDEKLQAKETRGETPEVTSRIEANIKALMDGGQPLPESTRAFFEPRFGYDFSQVRIHTDAHTTESARAFNAQAYTVGRDVVFGAGQYAPTTSHGQRVLAHELAHVIQQESVSGNVQTPSKNILGNDLHEREAEAVANGFAAGEMVRVLAHGLAQGLQRWPLPIGGGSTQENECSGYEQDPESLSVETAKHFLDDVQPGVGSRLVKTTRCKANENRPERIECKVTFDDGEVIQVSIESKLHNVEGQRPTPKGREWCVYHFTCEGGVLQFHKKGCSADYRPKSSAPSGSNLVGSRAARGRSKTT